MTRKYIFYFLSTFLLVNIGSAQQQEVLLKTVAVEGNTLTPETMIRYTSGLNPGESIKPGDFSRAVKKLWQLGLFEDIQVRLDEEALDGVDITIVVVENHVLGQVKFEGNKKIKDDKLDEELAIKSGQRIRPHLITESIH